MKKHLFIIYFSAFFLTACQKTQEFTIDTPSELPTLHIYTEKEIEKEDYVSARYIFSENGQAEEVLWEVTGRIKGRGNSTWGMPKKPYKIKFDKKQAFFDQQKNKTWILLANYADKTLLRNYLAYQLASKLSTPYPPSHSFVEVYLNHKYQGNYLLTDQIEIKAGRVDIPELSVTDNSPDVITGGYLLEIDQRVKDKDKPYIETPTFPIRIRSPKAPSPEQLQYINHYVNEAESVLFGKNFQHPTEGFRKYFDEESMIRWIFVSEIFKNVDAKDFSSIFFHKDRHGKLTMGPVWDFDLSAGNAMHCEECMNPEGWYVFDHPWFKRMYEDPDFQEKVSLLWTEHKPSIQQILPSLKHMAHEIYVSQHNNFKLWPNFSDPNWAVAPGLHSFESHIDFLYDFLDKRIKWMDKELIGDIR